MTTLTTASSCPLLSSWKPTSRNAKLQVSVQYIPSTCIDSSQTSVLAGFFTLSPSGNFGNGTNNNAFSYVDAAGNTYFRTVNAALNNITLDHQSGTLAPSPVPAVSSAQVIVQRPLAMQPSDNVFGGVRLPGGRNAPVGQIPN